MRRLICCGLVGFALCGADTAKASTLLGSVPYITSGGTTSADYTNVSSVAIELGYTNNILAGACTIPMLGCDGIPTASLVPGAVFTFDATHGSNFALLASMLTNGINDKLWFATQLRNSSGAILFAGGQGGATEPQNFGGTTDFVGNTVTSITLTINGFELARQSASCGSTGPPGSPQGIMYCLDSVWTVYGTSDATAAKNASWGSLKSLYR